MIKFLFACIAAVLIAVWIMALLINAYSLPIVYFSYSEGHCVKVQARNPNYNCENLLERYEHRWSK